MWSLEGDVHFLWHLMTVLDNAIPLAPFFPSKIIFEKNQISNQVRNGIVILEIFLNHYYYYYFISNDESLRRRKKRHNLILWKCLKKYLFIYFIMTRSFFSLIHLMNPFFMCKLISIYDVRRNNGERKGIQCSLGSVAHHTVSLLILLLMVIYLMVNQCLKDFFLLYL